MDRTGFSSPGWAVFAVLGTPLLAAIAMLAAHYLAEAPDAPLRYAGLWLQLGGIGTAWWEISHLPGTTARGFTNVFHEWNLRFMKQSEPTVIHARAGIIEAASAKATVDATASMSLEELSKSLGAAQSEIATLKARVDRSEAATAKALKALQRDQTEGRESLKRELLAPVEQTFPIVRIGLLYLAAGALLATMAPEIAAAWEGRR